MCTSRVKKSSRLQDKIEETEYSDGNQDKLHITGRHPVWNLSATLQSGMTATVTVSVGLWSRKAREPGIRGVVADIIHVQKDYEVAIETALGGSIQNIVTDQ